MLYDLVIFQCSISTIARFKLSAGFHRHAAVTAATDEATAAIVRIKMSFK